MWPGPFGATMITSLPSPGGDAAVEDVEAVGEEEGGVRLEVRGDLVLVDGRLHLIREQDRHELRARDGLPDAMPRRGPRPLPPAVTRSPRAGPTTT